MHPTSPGFKQKFAKRIRTMSRMNDKIVGHVQTRPLRTSHATKLQITFLTKQFSMDANK